MKIGGYEALSISNLSESDIIHRKNSTAGDTITSEREGKSGLPEPSSQRAHALPPVSFQCVVWRSRSSAPASATMRAKNTTTIAEA